ncbi:threonine/serine exporter [Falseniella ignava]|uniref:Threonine/serine exporter n=1 Tax=Falseniella ignava TaxID=137730 RepID=A0A2I1K0B3_9LACT|nr:threonine/serine exporter family protein [Falseniella ignava]PKY89099.1 threonine/serine exporter [Falseniella ignava]
MTQQYMIYARTAELAGKILLESRAESYRVEETARHFLLASGLPVAEVSTNNTGLYLTLADHDNNMIPITMVTRVHNFSNRLGRIYKVNNVSRQLTSGQIDIYQAYDKLVEIDRAEYSEFNKDIANIFLVMSFTMLLGGGLVDILASSLVGTIVMFSRMLHKKLGLNEFIRGSVTTLSIALIAHGIDRLAPGWYSPDLVIIAGLMPLYPGTLVTNGIRDMLKGDYLSGVAFISAALVTAISLAIGVVLGIFIFRGVLR